MSLDKLDIYRVRNIDQATLWPCSGINFIYGNNGSGKSALLDAVFILGRARSFRSNSVKQVIQFNQSDLIVSGKLKNQQSSATSLGVQLGLKSKTIHLHHQEIYSRSELAHVFPVQIITPKSYLLLDGGPQIRREFMDWGGFNMHHDFFTVWRSFKKALSHRNTLLKNHDLKQINVWNHELVRYGTILAEYRQQYLTLLEPLIRKIADIFIKITNPEIKFFTGWEKDHSYLDCLHQDLEKDLKFGYTQSGPHRGDFVFYSDGRIAKDFVSRGQLKALVLTLKLAQIELFKSDLSQDVCLLIDDITSEFDSNNRNKLLSFLSQLDNQVFITTNELTEFGNIELDGKNKVFHVEQGKIKTM